MLRCAAASARLHAPFLWSPHPLLLRDSHGMRLLVNYLMVLQILFFLTNF
jgi:hypothetical protein